MENPDTAYEVSQTKLDANRQNALKSTRPPLRGWQGEGPVQCAETWLICP